MGKAYVEVLLMLRVIRTSIHVDSAHVAVKRQLRTVPQSLHLGLLWGPTKPPVHSLQIMQKVQEQALQHVFGPQAE